MCHINDTRKEERQNKRHWNIHLKVLLWMTYKKHPQGGWQTKTQDPAPYFLQKLMFVCQWAKMLTKEPWVMLVRCLSFAAHVVCYIRRSLCPPTGLIFLSFFYFLFWGLKETILRRAVRHQSMWAEINHRERRPTGFNLKGKRRHCTHEKFK